MCEMARGVRKVPVHTVCHLQGGLGHFMGQQFLWVHLMPLKISLGAGHGWLLMPVTPAVWEAELGASPKVRSLRPAWVTRMKLRLKKKQTTKKIDSSAVLPSPHLNWFSLPLVFLPFTPH